MNYKHNDVGVRLANSQNPRNQETTPITLNIPTIWIEGTNNHIKQNNLHMTGEKLLEKMILNFLDEMLDLHHQKQKQN